MVTSSEETDGSRLNFRRDLSLRFPSFSNYKEDDEQGTGTQLRRGGSLKVPRITERAADNPDYDGAELEGTNERPARPARHSAPAIAAPAREQLARSLLQLGCPLVSMPEPRGRVRSEHLQSSDSDDSSTTHNHHGTSHGHGQGDGQGQMDGFILPKVHVSEPPNTMDSSSILNGSAGSIGARSAPSTPLQSNQTGQQSIGGPQLANVGSNQSQSPPPKSPSHAALKCTDSQLSKPLSRSTPSMAAGGGQIQTTSNRSSTRSSPTSTSSARQKKFHRHFSQVAADERVLNYYSCALVGDILLQGHLYITPNYFAFYSNVFGYVTKLLIPTVSVLKISKEKTARIIPNAVAIATEDERHVFCSLLSRDSTFKLMKQVWDAAMEPRPVEDILPLPVEDKLLSPESLLVDDSEVNPEEDDSSMSESGTDLTSRPPTVCTDTDTHSVSIPRPNPSSPRLEQALLTKSSILPVKPSNSGTLLWGGLKPSTVIAILVALLAALYVSAALMMFRIDRLHTAYLNHPLASPERFTHDRLLQYLNSNLEQIVKVRQSLQTLSQQFVTMNEDNDVEPAVSGGTPKPEDAAS